MSILELLNEYTVPWRERKVVNPITGNLVKIKSLPPEFQEKYKPKAEKKAEAEHEKSAPASTKSSEDKQYVFDYYVFVPKEFDTVEDYIEANGGRIPVTNDSANVIKFFPEDGYIIKFNSTPIDAVKEYLAWNEEDGDDTIKDADFVELPDDKEKKNKFLVHNDYTIFILEPMDYINDIDIVNDTPDDDGYIEKESDNVTESFNMSVMDELDMLYEAESFDEATKSLMVYKDTIPEVISRIENTLAVIKSVNDNNPIETMIDNGMIGEDNSAKVKAEYELIYTQLTTTASSLSEISDRLNATIAGIKANQAVEDKVAEEEGKEVEAEENDTGTEDEGGIMNKLDNANEKKGFGK